MKKLLLVFLILLIPAWAWATCTGSGASYSCTAGSTVAQINTALSNVSAGGTVTCANGSYTWSSSISVNKAASLLCASFGGCNVTASGQMIDINPSASVTDLLRISGFNFTYTVSPGFVVFVEPLLTTANITKLRIDHCAFNTPGGNTIIQVGYTGNPAYTGYVNGVVDNNTFTVGAQTRYIQFNGSTSKDPTDYPEPMGTVSNLYFEHNVMANSGSYNPSSGDVDNESSMPIVYRFNTLTNGRFSIHGFCNNRGPLNWEVYNNQIYLGVDDGSAVIHHQGAFQMMVFNNLVNRDTMTVQFYRDLNNPICSWIGASNGACSGSNANDENRSPTGTYQGYRCWGQPGSDANKALRPIYVWNNRVGTPPNWNTKAALSVPQATHIVNDRDVYQAVSYNAQTSSTSPFNGSTGMGFGTLANRPTSCTPTGDQTHDAGQGGVGYFATNTNTLYTCTATDTWSVHYTPYQCPHPLVTELSTKTCDYSVAGPSGYAALDAGGPSAPVLGPGITISGVNFQ